MTALARALAILVALAAIAVAQPSPEAVRLYNEGQAAYDAKDYPAALAAWKQSYELSKLPGLVFNIAQAHRLNGDCREAVDSYRTFVELDPGAPERADAEAFIAELEPTCPKPVVKDPPPEPTRPVVTTVRDPSPPPIVQPPPRRSGRGKKIAAIAVGVAGLALVGGGVYMGNRATTLGDEVAADCANGCVWDDLRDKDADGRAAERNQYILYGAGAAALGTAVVLYWLGARGGETVTVTPRGDGAAVSFSGRW